MPSSQQQPTLYHVPKTISSPIYQALLELKLVDNPVRVQSLTFSDLKTKDHLARNPMGTSPAFTDQDCRIWESGAVLTYLLTTYDTQYQLHPNPNTCRPADLAKFLQLQQFIIATAYPFIASLYIHTVTKSPPEQDAGYVQQGKYTIRTKLLPILSESLGDAPYFMGHELSVIDLLAAKPFNNLASLGLLPEFPTLQAHLERIQNRPSFEEAYSDASSNHVCVECRSMVLIPGDDDDDNKK